MHVPSPPPNDFDWITPDMAVGGWVEQSGWSRLARQDGITAVIDCREEARNDPLALQESGLRALHVPTMDRGPVSPAMIDRAVAFARAEARAGGRLLVHCHHGIGRSAMVALCILVDRGHEPLDALELAKTSRWKISPSPEQFEGWAAWIRARSPEFRIPDFDAFARIAYRHLAEADVDLR